MQCGLTETLKIPLHSNVQWESAFNMLDQAYKLQQVSSFSLHHQLFAKTVCQPIKLFISATDELYGPITVIHWNGHILKKIQWSAFKLSDWDWARVLDTKSILEVCLSYFICLQILCLTSHILRMQTTFNNISHLSDNQHYGMHSLK